MKLVLLAIVSTFILQETTCAKILGVFPVHTKSHYFLGSSLMRGLAEKGHDVTVISTRGEKNPPKNGTYRDIIVTSEMTKTDGPGSDLFVIDRLSFITYNLFMNYFGNMITDITLGHPDVQALIQSNEKFDAVIIEQFVDDGLKVLAHHFQAPLVLFSTCASNSWINPLVGNPAPPAYIPEQNIKFNSENFLDRVKNTVIYTFGLLNRNLLFFPAQDKIVKKYFPDAPDLEALNYNASLVLLNSHWSTNMAVPRVPNMVDIGGFHIKPPKKLPQDLQKYLDEATEGVVYFSMGSALQSTNLPVEKREALLKVFSKLKQKVLWKWESDVLPGQPKNVRLEKWLPQQDILAHPNVKAFITHGGLLSFIESVYHGVPILAIPVYGDQIWNADEAETNGFGRYVLYRELDESKLEEALNDVLNNPRYSKNMKTRSKIMHDRRHSPIDDADYWIQYVIRHQGAPHLKVGGLELSWYQYLALDVVLFIAVVTPAALYLLYFFIKLVVKNLRKTPDNKVKKS